MATKRPTPAMLEVLRMMLVGWQLGHRGGLTGGYWLQKGGCGKGGESKDVNSLTICGLRDRGMIEVDVRGFPTIKYRLTERADEALLEAVTHG